jgi:hypothetical protein
MGGVWIDVTQVIWKLTPDWDASLAKTVTFTPNPPYATASVMFPRPPTGSANTVSIAMSGTCHTNGGYLNGYNVPSQPVPFYPDNSRKVAFTGSDTETINWNLVAIYVGDPTSVEFAVQPQFTIISP